LHHPAPLGFLPKIHQQIHWGERPLGLPLDAGAVGHLYIGLHHCTKLGKPRKMPAPKAVQAGFRCTTAPNPERLKMESPVTCVTRRRFDR
jgi:hypothetical protein